MEEKIKIKYVVFISFSVFVIICAALLRFFMEDELAQFQTERTGNYSQEILGLVQNDIENSLDKIAQDAKGISENASVQKYLSGEPGLETLIKNIVKATAAADKDIIQIALYDSEGNIMPASTGYGQGIYPAISTQSLDSDVVDSYGFTGINKYVLRNETKNNFAYVYKVYRGDALAGYCVNYYNLNKFETIISGISEKTMFDVMISDPEGSIIKAPFGVVSSYADLSDYENLTDHFRKITSDKRTAVDTYVIDGQKTIVSAGAVSSTKSKSGATWGVVVTAKEKDISLGTDDLEKNVKFVINAALVVQIAAFGIMIFMLLKPMDTLSQVFEKLESGEKKAKFHGKCPTDVCKIGYSVNKLVSSLNEAEERYNTIVGMTDNIIFEYDVAKDSVIFTSNFNTKFSFRAKTSRFEDSFFVNGQVLRKKKAEFERFVDSMLEGKAVQGEFCFKTIYNDYAWYIVRCACIRGNDDEIVKIIGVMIDIDRAKRREKNLMKMASYDSLTQILNRQSFEESLLNEYELSHMRKTRVAVLFIDIDDFKYYNNNFGHALGDETLTFISSTLKRIAGENGFAGRYGGDEFVLCYSELPGGKTAVEVAKEIIRELGKGFDGVSVQKHFEVSCSVGISYFTEHSDDADSVIKDADEAMYTVKKNGKSGYAYYSKPRS